MSPEVVKLLCFILVYSVNSYPIEEKLLFPSLPIAAVNSGNPICKDESESYIFHLQNSTLWAHEIHSVNSHPIEEKPLFPSLPIAAVNSENPMCKKESEAYILHLQNSTLWAHEMRDASAKSVVGILRGASLQAGDYDECLTTEAPFKVQYCLVTISAQIPPEFIPKDTISLDRDYNGSVLERLYKTDDVSQQDRHVIKTGWCIPASCTPEDLTNELAIHFESEKLPFEEEGVTYVYDISNDSCQTPGKEMKFDAAATGFCALTAMLVALVTIATVNDDVHKGHPGKQRSSSGFVRAFSANRTFNELAEADMSNPALSCLYGVRTICMLFIISSHRVLLNVKGGLMNGDYHERMNRNMFAAFTFKEDLIVDSFFALSGLLVTYTLLSQFNKKCVNPLLIILLRYIRLTPTLAFVIFYYVTILDYTGSGPAWKTFVTSEVDDCKNNWYWNLIYMNNYINLDHICIIQTWYLPADFHFFIVGVFVCLIIKNAPKLGMMILMILIVLSAVAPFLVTYYNMNVAVLFFFPGIVDELKSDLMFNVLYVKSHTRCGPYFIGMIAGYIYYKLKDNKNTRLSGAKSFMIMWLSTGVMLTCMIGGTVFFNPYHGYDVIESAVYAALHRTAWSIGSVGLLFVASYGHSPFLTGVLTWKPWIPLSKLTYGAYLTHMQFQLRSIGISPGPLYFDYFEVISLSIGDWVLAFSAAFVLYLLIEAPFKKIFKILMEPSKRTTVNRIPA